MACTCKDIIPQSKECYAQQIVVKIPEYLDIRMNAPGRERKEFVALDPCITSEVIQLWRLGIVTTGSCCGHNLPDGFPFIGVEDEYIPKMKELGYEVAHNKCRPNDEDSFVPKSVGVVTIEKAGEFIEAMDYDMVLAPVSRNYLRRGDKARMKDGEILTVRSLEFKEFCSEEKIGYIPKKDIDTVIE